MFNIESVIQHLMPYYRRVHPYHPKSVDEAKGVLEKHLEVSCLVIQQENDHYIFDELLCENKTCIDRSRNVFNSIKSFIGNHNIQVKGLKFIFHYKGDACNLLPEFALLSNSRNVGNERIVLWPLLMKREYLFSRTRYSPYLHDEVTRYRGKPDRIPWDDKKTVFVFRGRNSGNPFSAIQYPWNQFRHSRCKLLTESLKLPQELRSMVDIGFIELYPKIRIVRKIIRDAEYLETTYTKYLRDGCDISDLKKDMEISLSHIKPSIDRGQLCQYKYQFCPEGFDCSSALTWVLASQCLAIAPPIHYENVIVNSRALQPHVHFLPIREDYGDLEEVMRWALAHDEECRQIVCNANAYMGPFVDEGCMIQAQKRVIEYLLG